MPAVKDLNELLAIAIGWEEQLTAYFDELEHAFVNTSCRQILSLLKSSHLKSCNILHGIHAEDFGADEWLSCAPDDIDPSEILIPSHKLKETTPHEILRRILVFEESIQNFYYCIAGIVVSRDQRDLFESLAKSKERHIFEIRSCLDYESST